MSPSTAFRLIAFLAFTAALTFAQADPTPTLNSLEQTARNSVGDLSHLRIEKWKTDGNTRKSAQADSESIQRNLGSALPELIAGVRSKPQDLNANFKLYRNLNALYDVFSRFAETTGAFGSRDEYQTIAKDLDAVESARRALADRLDALTASAESELDQFRSQAKTAQAPAAAAPAKKVVIDDSEPEKKPAKKKAKSASPATSVPSSNSSSAAPK